MGLLTTNDLAGLGGPGWYGTHAPARAFHEGVRVLGGGPMGKIKMQEIWAQRRPAGFWGSKRGAGWKRVSPGNMTPAMLRVLLREIQKYEEASGVDARYRVTPPRGRRPRRRRAPRVVPRPKPQPRPKTTPRPPLVAALTRPRPRPTTGQPYARQAAHGKPGQFLLATGQYGYPKSYVSLR